MISCNPDTHTEKKKDLAPGDFRSFYEKPDSLTHTPTPPFLLCSNPGDPHAKISQHAGVTVEILLGVGTCVHPTANFLGKKGVREAEKTRTGSRKMYMIGQSVRYGVWRIGLKRGGSKSRTCAFHTPEAHLGWFNLPRKAWIICRCGENDIVREKNVHSTSLRLFESDILPRLWGCIGGFQAGACSVTCREYFAPDIPHRSGYGFPRKISVGQSRLLFA